MEQQNRTLAAGRYAFQTDAETRIAADVLAKLQPLPTSRFLDIGCGPGLLIEAIEPHVGSYVGIDSPDQIQIARRVSRSAELVSGDFLKTDFAGSFDRILIYSVIHCLPDFEAVLTFVSKSVGLLAIGGRLLIGDIPNFDTKTKFLASSAGAEFHSRWSQANKVAPARSENVIGSFTDAQVMAMIARFRLSGLLSYVLPQPPDLPFGHTREDLLIVRP